MLGMRKLRGPGPLLVDVTHNMRLASEEMFGPVAALFAFDEEEEVIREANR